MKGISHFISGITIASFCPWALDAAAQSNPAYFILAGAAAILPDTLDFKFYRFFYRYDQYITPDPRNPEPQAIAEQIADAVEKAMACHRLYRLKINTLRLSADTWQQFSIRFDPQTQEVIVHLGPVVNTGQIPIPGTFPDGNCTDRKKLPAPIEETYETVSTVDIFDGPAYGLEMNGEGKVLIHFLPWHRNWTHSLILAALLAAVTTLISDWRAGVVVFGASSIHILEDQLGFMGSNLFAPFTKKRLKGLHWMRSGDALPNFATVWFCCLLIFWNCYRVIPDPIYHFGFVQLLFYGGILPLTIFGVLHLFLTRKAGIKEKIDTANEWGEKTV